MRGPGEMLRVTKFFEGNETLDWRALHIISQDQPSYSRERMRIVELYDELRPSLYGYLVCLGLLPQEADDIIQDTFLRLFTFLQSGGKVENLRSWIFRVAHNLSLNLQKRERRLVHHDSAEGSAEMAANAAGTPNPEDLYLRKERLLRLDHAISLLPSRQKQCLYLRAEGLRYREIAVVLGITTSGVSESLKRAINQLLDVLYG